MKAILLAILLVLIPATVSADELWILNEGGLEVTVEGTVTDVQYDGISAFNPDNGMVCAADITTGWVVITGDIQGYDITLACGQDFEDVVPESYIVRDVVVAPQMHENDDSGPSIADLDLTVEIADYNASHGWLNAIPC